jgi:hypothetical protein
MAPIDLYISGIITKGYLVAGLFFLRFWRRSADGLFLAFALAFWLLALNTGVAGLGGVSREELSYVYLLRLAAFSLIIIAIIRNNMEAARRRNP